MAIAVRCEACRIEASAIAPHDLHAFLDQHRDPDVCAERAQHAVDVTLWLSVPLPRTA